MKKMNVSLEIQSKCCDMAVEADMEKSYYPSFHYSGPEELPIAKEGKMLVEYKIVSSEERERNGEESYSCCVEIRRILEAEPEEGDMPTRRDTSTSDALDALAAEVAKRVEAQEGEETEDEGEE